LELKGRAAEWWSNMAFFNTTALLVVFFGFCPLKKKEVK
jgi:hypothetical protein